MSLKHHGVVVPEGTDLADGPKAFRDLVDFGNAVPLFETLAERDAWTSPPDGCVAIVLAGSGVPRNVIQQYQVGIGWRNYDTTPIGVVQMFSGTSPPTADYLICNGQAVPAGNEYDALRALVGANVPDLRDRFVVGNSGTKAIGATGGAATVALSIANMPAHNHGGTTGSASTTHSHTATSTTTVYANEQDRVTRLSVAQPYSWVPNIDTNGDGLADAYGSPGGMAISYESEHGHVASTSTAVNADNASHSHTVSISSQGSGTAVDKMPPYYALAFIIRAR